MKYALFSFFLLIFAVARTQISGEVNDYTPVTAIDCNTITVQSASAFGPGDRALIIQMKGAVIDSMNTSNFGTILNYGNCGNYEFVDITAINGNVITTAHLLLNDYTISGLVQLIRVPQYNDVTVYPAINAAEWNGSTGGVLVIEVSGTLTLDGPVMASGTGFRGGSTSYNPDGSCGAGYPNYSYPLALPGFGAEKGEGIAQLSVNNSGGRGANGNGGGGGNKHNSGGGGGSNGATGGKGGNEASFCFSGGDVGGDGGQALDYSTGRLFCGGGGGAPDHNNGVGSSGTDGGGIIIIRAATLQSNNSSIETNGLMVATIPNGIGDGAGGGGAGGTILLDVQNFSGNLIVSAFGGYGGNQLTSYPSCFGPGGGGSGGTILSTSGTLPGNVTISNAGGLAGTDLHPSSSCYQQHFGATDGQTGPVLYNQLIHESQLDAPVVDLGPDFTACNSIVTFDATNNGATYNWSTGETTPAITVNAPGEYWVEVSIGNCTASDTIVYSGATFELGPDITSCGPTGVIDATTAGASGYIWSTGETTSSITVSEPGDYWVTVSINGCAISDTLTFTSVVVDLGPDIMSCDTSVILNATVPGATYNWSTGETTPAITIGTPGTYWVDVTVGNCTVSDTIVFFLQTSPDAAFSPQPSILQIGNTVVELQNHSTGGTTYSWHFGDGSPGSDLFEPQHAFPSEPGTYIVTLIVTSDAGCTDIAYGAVTVEDDLIYFVPNAFTPDDNEFNQVFLPVFTSGFDPYAFHLQLYNRWGELIFESNDHKIGWDGTYNGQPVPEGVYTWRITFKRTRNDEHRVIEGHVNVLR